MAMGDLLFDDDGNLMFGRTGRVRFDTEGICVQSCCCPLGACPPGASAVIQNVTSNPSVNGNCTLRGGTWFNAGVREMVSACTHRGVIGTGPALSVLSDLTTRKITCVQIRGSTGIFFFATGNWDFGEPIANQLSGSGTIPGESLCHPEDVASINVVGSGGTVTVTVDYSSGQCCDTCPADGEEVQDYIDVQFRGIQLRTGCLHAPCREQSVFLLNAATLPNPNLTLRLWRQPANDSNCDICLNPTGCPNQYGSLYPVNYGYLKKCCTWFAPIPVEDLLGNLEDCNDLTVPTGATLAVWLVKAADGWGHIVMALCCETDNSFSHIVFAARFRACHCMGRLVVTNGQNIPGAETSPYTVDWVSGRWGGVAIPQRFTPTDTGLHGWTWLSTVSGEVEIFEAEPTLDEPCCFTISCPHCEDCDPENESCTGETVGFRCCTPDTIRLDTAGITLGLYTCLTDGTINSYLLTGTTAVNRSDIYLEQNTNDPCHWRKTIASDHILKRATKHALSSLKYRATKQTNKNWLLEAWAEKSDGTMPVKVFEKTLTAGDCATTVSGANALAGALCGTPRIAGSGGTFAVSVLPTNIQLTTLTYEMEKTSSGWASRVFASGGGETVWFFDGTLSSNTFCEQARSVPNSISGNLLSTPRVAGSGGTFTKPATGVPGGGTDCGNCLLGTTPASFSATIADVIAATGACFVDTNHDYKLTGTTAINRSITLNQVSGSPCLYRATIGSNYILVRHPTASSELPNSLSATISSVTVEFGVCYDCGAGPEDLWKLMGSTAINRTLNLTKSGNVWTGTVSGNWVLYDHGNPVQTWSISQIFFEERRTGPAAGTWEIYGVGIDGVTKRVSYAGATSPSATPNPMAMAGLEASKCVNIPTQTHPTRSFAANGTNHTVIAGSGGTTAFDGCLEDDAP